jgi:hypothetical protein
LAESLVQRAKIILQAAEGTKNKVISADLKVKEKNGWNVAKTLAFGNA